MKFTICLSTLLIALTSVTAQLKVTEPRTDHWWVAQSLNTLAWEGSSPDQFSVFISNSDTNVLTSILALTSVTFAYDRSKTINPGGITPSGGYTILLTNPLNSTDVYAKSETFEIKAVGSSYPPQGSPTAGSSASVSGSGSPSGSASSSAASTSSSSGSSSSAIKSKVGFIGGLVALVGLVAGGSTLI